MQDEAYCILEPNIETHQVFKITQYHEAVDKADIIDFLLGYKGVCGARRKSGVGLLRGK